MEQKLPAPHNRSLELVIFSQTKIDWSDFKNKMSQTQRFHVFRNGDFKRTQGAVLVWDVEFSYNQSLDDLKNRALQLLKISLPSSLDTIRVFSEHGSEFTERKQLRDGDVLFISTNKDNFLNRILELKFIAKKMNPPPSHGKSTTPEVSTTDLAVTTPPTESLPIKSVASSPQSCKLMSSSLCPTFTGSNTKLDKTTLTISSVKTKGKTMIDLNRLLGSTIDEVKVSHLKRFILSNGRYKEILLGKSNFPLKFTQDIVLIHQGKELKEDQSLIPWMKSLGCMDSEMDVTLFLMARKPIYYVKLFVENSSFIVVDSDTINFETSILDFKKYVERKMSSSGASETSNRNVILMWNQKKLLDESVSIGEAFPINAVLNLVFM